MKNSTRFVSAILAAILCGAAFSACANEIKPPVTDVKTDAPITDAPDTIAPITTVTTDAYTTDAPVTTEAPETTDAPITETTDTTTEGVETADTSTTDTSTTAAPATDAPSVTTEAPVTTQVAITAEAVNKETSDTKEQTEIEREKLKELLYISADGYVKIKGSNNIKLPRSGTYISYDKSPEIVYFTSPYLQTTEPLSSIPLYSGTNSAHSFTAVEGGILIRYNHGKSVFKLSKRITAYDSLGKEHIFNDITDREFHCYYISPSLTYFTYSDYCSCGDLHTILIKIHNMGESTEFIACEYTQSISHIWFDNNGIAYASTGIFAAGGSSYQSLLLSTDGGKTFEEICTMQVVNAYCSDAAIVALNGTLYEIGGYYSTIPQQKLDKRCIDISFENQSDFWRGLYQQGKYTDMPPYFDGDIGVKAVKIQTYTENLQTTFEGFIYYVTLDGGNSWTPYNPAELVSTTTHKELEYKEKISK